MCGINGIFSYRINNSSASLKQMNCSIAHRGPDAMGEFIEENIALGHSRLSVIDLSSVANQPLFDNSKNFVLVFNGEIYNYLEIKSQLPEYEFKTNSDTEVILAAYLKWGIHFLNFLNGMFALAIYDRSKNELFIARDRMGIKPLYFYHDEEAFVFSSEIRALLNSDLVPRKLNKNGLSDYLRYQTVHAPKTLVDNVLMLMPGHYMKISNDDFITQSYWEMTTPNLRLSAAASLSEYQKQIKECFYDSVSKRTIADVPMGAFLSGGIDSAAIVGVLSEVSTKKVDTFTVVFDEREFSEAEAAQKMADRFNTNHHEINLSSSEFLEEIPSALSAMDHPSGDGINTYIVSKATKEAGITVALSGLGGDELFSGYPVFRQLNSLSDKKWLISYPKALRKLAGTALNSIKKTVASEKVKEIIALDSLDLEFTYPFSRQLYTDKHLKNILNESIIENQVKKLAADSIAYNTSGYNLPFQSKVSILEMKSYMQNVLLRDADQMSMAHALEVRVPFLDHNLVELMLSVPININ